VSECEYSGGLGVYHDGELDAVASADVERHLGSCAGCAAEMGRLRRLSGLLAAASRPALSPRAMRRLHASAELASSTGLRHWAEALTAVAAAILVALSVWLWRLPLPSEPAGAALTWETAALQRPSETASTTPEDQLATWLMQDLARESANGKN